MEKRKNSYYGNIAVIIAVVLCLLAVRSHSIRTARENELIYNDYLTRAKEYVVQKYEPDRTVYDIRVALGPRGYAYWIISEYDGDVVVNDDRDLVALISRAVDAQTECTEATETESFCDVILLTIALFFVACLCRLIMTAIHEHRKM